MIRTIPTPRNRTRPMTGQPRVVLGVSDFEQADLIERVLLRLGWRAERADSARKARRLLCDFGSPIAILGIDFADESGWLTCAKLTIEPRQATVLMIGPTTPRNRLLARTAGAAALLADPVEVADWIPYRRLDLRH